jgi:hypothetical protein
MQCHARYSTEVVREATELELEYLLVAMYGIVCVMNAHHQNSKDARDLLSCSPVLKTTMI